MVRWGLALAGIKLNIQPRKGHTNANADTLSRLPDSAAKPVFDIETDAIARPQESKHEPNVNSISDEQINLKKLQRDDQFLNQIITSLSDNEECERCPASQYMVPTLNEVVISMAEYEIPDSKF
uniref:Uncharacterized protein n=1 Tax=Romanomermis culicivorax TaxID=13658 RepID=A0A915KWV2_ROMCU